ncbi:peptidoglycan DD-metalloendopeptidase family protein [Desulfonauticus submarinus]
MLCLFIFLFVGITGVNIYFGYRAINYTNLQNLYHKTAAKLEKQNSQLLAFAKKIKQLEANVAKMSELDRKLRVMMNLEGSTNLLEAIGGTPENSFTFDFIPSYRQEALARKMHNFLEQLTTQTKLEKVRQEQLIELLKNKQAILASTPSIWPTQGWISSGFGYRISPFTGQREFHKGLDISGPVGTPIIAPADGVVVFCGVNGGYGLSLLIDHGNGISTRYAHLQKAVVKKGERVKRGEIIAYMGNSGRSTGPHLHYEVRINGVPVNPLHYILN